MDKDGNRTNPRRERNPRLDTQGRVTPPERLQAGRRRRTIYFGELDTDALGRFVARICDSGSGLVLGRTTDGGALSITIMDGHERIREYPTTVEDAEDLFKWVDAVYELPNLASSTPPTKDIG